MLADGRLWDRWNLGRWLDERAAELPGRYRPLLLVEVWTALLYYGAAGAGRRVLAVMVETGDWTGVRWRSGSAWSGERATDWLWKVVNRLRSSGVERITVRFEKGSSRRTTSGLCGTSESSTC